MAKDNEIQIVIQVATAQGKAEIKEFSSTAEREFKGVEKSGRRFLGKAGLAGIMAAASGAVALGVNRMVQKGKEFEQQMADLQAITGITGDRLDFLGDQALENSVQYGEAASNIVEAQKLVASQLAESIDFDTQAGTQQLQRVAEQAVVLQKAAGSDLNTAVETLTSSINQFNLDASESERLINAIAAGSKFGAAELPDQAAALRDSGTAAANANRSFEELNASIQVLATNGQTGTRVGTALRSIFTRLETRAQKLAENGIDNVNVKTDDWATTLTKLQPLLQDAQAMVDVFGEEHQNVARILIQNAESVEEMTEKVTGGNTAYEQAAIQLDTYNGAASQLSAAIDNQLIPAFQESGGVMVQGIQTLTEWVGAVGHAIDVINEWTDENSDYRKEAELNTKVTQGRIQSIQNEIEALREQANAENATAKERENARQGIEYYEQQLKQEGQALRNNVSQFRSYIDYLKQQRDEAEEAGHSSEALDNKIEQVEITYSELNKRLKFYNQVTSDATNSTQQNTEATDQQAISARNAAMSLKEYVLAVEAARNAQNEGEPSGDIITSGGTNISELERKSPRQAELFSPFNEVEQEMMQFSEQQQDVIDGWEKIQTGADDTAAKLKPAEQAFMTLASSLAQAGLQGRGLLGVLENIAAQLASRALLTGLKILLTGGIGSVSFFGELFSSFGFSDGGKVIAAAGGGKIYGPGTTTSDSILARLSDQEFVVNAASANAMPEVLEAANQSPAAAKQINQFYTTMSRAPRFANGGRVGSVPSIPSSRYPDLDIIDRVVDMNRQQDQGEHFRMLADTIEDQTRRLEEVERRIDFKLADFDESYNQFKNNEEVQGRL